MSVLSDLRKSKYLKKEDCPLRLTIDSAEWTNVAMQGQKPEMTWVLYFKETDKGLILNNANGQIMYENTGSDGGDDCSPWFGKVIELYNEPNVFYGQKRTGGIRIRSNVTEPDIESVNRDLAEATERNKTRRRLIEEDEHGLNPTSPF